MSPNRRIIYSVSLKFKHRFLSIIFCHHNIFNYILENICVEIYGFIVILNEFSMFLEAVNRFSVKEADIEEVIKKWLKCARDRQIGHKRQLKKKKGM